MQKEEDIYLILGMITKVPLINSSQYFDLGLLFVAIEGSQLLLLLCGERFDSVFGRIRRLVA
jgi:hypothetical protein